MARSHQAKPLNSETIELPVRDFLYTLDQVEMLTQIPMQRLMKDFIHFQGRDEGMPNKRRMVARNINSPGARYPDWRVSERNLIKWMMTMGFSYKRRGEVE